MEKPIKKEKKVSENSVDETITIVDLRESFNDVCDILKDIGNTVDEICQDLEESRHISAAIKLGEIKRSYLNAWITYNL